MNEKGIAAAALSIRSLSMDAILVIQELQWELRNWPLCFMEK